MADIAFIVDSSASFPKEWYDNNGLDGLLVTQHGFAFPGEGHIRELEVNPEEFYAKLNTTLRATGRIPTTAGPNVAEFSRLYDAAFGKAEKVLVLTMMKENSGTHNFARVAAQEHPRSQDITVIDTHTVGPGVAFIARAARQYSESHSLDDTIAYAGKLSRQARIYMVPQDLRFLQRGGRVKVVNSMTALEPQVFPVITIERVNDAQAEQYRSVPIARSENLSDALVSVLRYVARDAEGFRAQELSLVDAVVVHANNLSVAAELKNQIGKLLANFGFAHNFEPATLLTPVLGTHFGPGTVGVAMLYRKSS